MGGGGPAQRGYGVEEVLPQGEEAAGARGGGGGKMAGNVHVCAVSARKEWCPLSACIFYSGGDAVKRNERAAAAGWSQPPRAARSKLLVFL